MGISQDFRFRRRNRKIPIFFFFSSRVDIVDDIAQSRYRRRYRISSTISTLSDQKRYGCSTFPAVVENVFADGRLYMLRAKGGILEQKFPRKSLILVVKEQLYELKSQPRSSRRTNFILSLLSEYLKTCWIPPSAQLPFALTKHAGVAARPRNAHAGLLGTGVGRCVILSTTRGTCNAAIISEYIYILKASFILIMASVSQCMRCLAGASIAVADRYALQLRRAGLAKSYRRRNAISSTISLK